MVDSTGSKTTLDDLEASSFPEDHAALVDADILESDVAVTVWGIVKAHDREHSVDGNTWGVCGHEYD